MSSTHAWLAVSDTTRWIWPLACLITLAGYFGSWVSHPVAGLAITGLDMGEYVKFLPAITGGSVSVWRQGFYAPLVAVSTACSLLAYRRTYRYAFWVRLALILLGVAAILNLLPPAWSPASLRTEEFHLQVYFIVFGLALTVLSPLLAMLPALPVYSLLALLGLAGIWFPVTSFLKILPGIGELYGHGLRPGWAFYVLNIGLVLLIVACWIGVKREKLAS